MKYIRLQWDEKDPVYTALCEMAEEDCRFVAQEVRHILTEYVKDHARYRAKQEEENA